MGKIDFMGRVADHPDGKGAAEAFVKAQMDRIASSAPGTTLSVPISAKTKRVSPLNEKQKSDILEAFRSTGLSDEAMAEKFGIKPSQVTYLLKSYR